MFVVRYTIAVRWTHVNMRTTRVKSEGWKRVDRDWTKATIGERLEHVREHIAEAPNLRDFWRRLLEHEDPPISEPFSYDAVRTWHADREPPISYVTRVAEVFDMTLHWLLTGRDPMTVQAALDNHFREVEREVARRLEEEREEGPRPYFIGGVPGQEVMPMDDLTRNGLIAVWQEVVRLRDEELGEILENGRTRGGQLWYDLQRAVAMPLNVLELPLPTERYDPFDDYAVAVAVALRRYVRALIARADPDEQA